MCEFGGHLTQIELEAEQNRQSIKESGSSGSYANHSSREPLEKRTGFARFPRLKEFTIDYSTRMHNWKVFDAESVRVRERAVADCLTLSLHNLKCLRPNLVIAFKKWYSKQLYGFDIDSESTSKGTNQLAMQQIWNESRDAFLAHELTQVSTSEPEPKEKEASNE